MPDSFQSDANQFALLSAVYVNLLIPLLCSGLSFGHCPAESQPQPWKSGPGTLRLYSSSTCAYSVITLIIPCCMHTTDVTRCCSDRSTLSAISIFAFQPWFKFLHPPTSVTMTLKGGRNPFPIFFLSHIHLCVLDFDCLYLVCFPFMLEMISNPLPFVKGIFITVCFYLLFTNYSYSI